MEILVYSMAAVALIASVAMLLFPQPLHSAFCLIVTMTMLAGLFAALDAHFLAATQIIVYAGAIMVLVVFVIMLLSIQGKEREPIGPFSALLSLAVAASFLAIIVPLIDVEFSEEQASAVAGDVASMGELLFTKYVFPFEAASILIIAAMVGAVMLGRKKETGKEPQH